MWGVRSDPLKGDERYIHLYQPLVFLHKQKHDFDEFLKESFVNVSSRFACTRTHLQDTLGLISLTFN